MSSAKRPVRAAPRASAPRSRPAVRQAAVVAVPPPAEKHPFLIALGERVRAQRTACGLTRKALAQATGVSERHLANLEYGVGNASILILVQVAEALRCPLAALLGDATTATPEWLQLRALLDGRDEETLRRARVAVGRMLGVPGARGVAADSTRIALVGLRGAGKSTLGAMLAEDLGFPFVELSREIERLAGCSISEIQALYGQNAYRRHERRALEETVRRHPEAVIATPGGIVSDPATFQLLLDRCATVWLRAEPRDHMQRVIDQGDMRPMAASREAMKDLALILEGRTPFYARARMQLDTSAQPLDDTFHLLRTRVRESLGMPAA